MKIKLINPNKDLVRANKLIDKIKKINNHSYNITICIDYNLKYAGFFETDDSHKILINPERCKKSNLSFPGYTNDGSIFGTAIHEFSHFLSMIYFKTFIDEYRKSFKRKLIISTYQECYYDIEEEIAEIFVLYISNPYFLKLIDEDHYIFITKYFKSPIPCTKKRFIKIYNTFSDKTKEKIKEKWKICVDKNKIINERKNCEKNSSLSKR